jgi:hypothetical protein
MMGRGAGTVAPAQQHNWNSQPKGSSSAPFAGNANAADAAAAAVISAATHHSVPRSGGTSTSHSGSMSWLA